MRVRLCAQARGWGRARVHGRCGHACVRVEEGRKTQPFFCFSPCGAMDRLPVFVRLSINGASQVGEGQGALKAEVVPTTRKRFNGRDGMHWTFPNIS